MNVNKELILLYYGIGRIINGHKSWGNKFIENLAADIKLSFPEAKGYSVRNLKYMAKFAATYEDEGFVQTASAQIPWSHNKVSLDKGVSTSVALQFPKRLQCPADCFSGCVLHQITNKVFFSRCGNISLVYRKRGDFSSLYYSFGNVSHNLIAVYQ